MNENEPKQKKDVIYAKGLKGVIATETGLSDVRGEEGHLLYCGYEIEDLVDLCSFTEIIYLLLNKRLPNREELEGLQQRLLLTIDTALAGQSRQFLDCGQIHGRKWCFLLWLGRFLGILPQ